MNNKQKKLSVKILSQSFYPDFVAAGELLFELGHKLVHDYNLDVSVVTAQPSFVKKNILPKHEIIDGVKIQRINTFSFNKNELKGKILNSHSFFWFIMHHINWSKKVDWLLIPTSPPLLTLIGTYAKFLKGQKYIYLMHDIYPEIAEKLDYIKKDGFIYKLWGYLTGLSLKYADKIITLSSEMKEWTLKKYKNLDPSKIYVVHNWANEEKMKVIPDLENHFRDKFNLRNKFIVEYSGNIGRIHEFDTMINAAKELNENEDIIFLFIGDGGKKVDIENKVNSLNLTNVLFLPYQERADLPYSIGMADVHILSLQNDFENFSAPCKLYGILACGKPTIFVGSNNCYISIILEENNCGFNVPIGDHNKLVELLLMLKNSNEKLIELGQNGRIVFENNFTLNITAKKYYDILVN